MLKFKNVYNHLKTITHHKIIVGKLLCRCGLYRQAFLHDLSKYSFIELKTGFKYYQGFRSPIDYERELKGYSLGWLHHKGRNKHHWEYWMDNAATGLVPIEIPTKYLVEMFCDRVGASMNYLKDQYTDQSPLNYYQNAELKVNLHPNSQKLLEQLLTMLADKGLDETINYIKQHILN